MCMCLCVRLCVCLLQLKIGHNQDDAVDQHFEGEVSFCEPCVPVSLSAYLYVGVSLSAFLSLRVYASTLVWTQLS